MSGVSSSAAAGATTAAADAQYSSSTAVSLTSATAPLASTASQDQSQTNNTEDKSKLKAWEKKYDQTWNILQEDAEGTLLTGAEEIERAKRRRLIPQLAGVRRGMMRHLMVIVDMSLAMNDPDLRPSRLEHTLRLLEQFIVDFFEQNPISQMGLIKAQDGKAIRMSELGGNPQRHIELMRSRSSLEGEISLQNSLELALDTLKNMPSHTSREILIIMGSLTTCDPGDINKTISLLHLHDIHCSIIGLAAEVRVCKFICEATQGTYNVILDEAHYHDVLFQHVVPPPTTSKTAATLIRMGFASQSDSRIPTMCARHNQFKKGGYICPQCKSKYCDLPIDCVVCGITLVASPHLARSYYHLFPLALFVEKITAGSLISTTSEKSTNMLIEKQSDSSKAMQSDGIVSLPDFLQSCKGCWRSLSAFRVFYTCPSCKYHFCYDCDVFVHDILHNCPGCSAPLAVLSPLD